MTDQISMTELGKRWGITRQGAANLARTRQGFPETTKQGRTVTVSWKKAKRWREEQKKAELAIAMRNWNMSRLSYLRGQLYRYAQRMDGIYAWLWIDKARTVDASHALAVKWRMRLDDYTVGPDGKHANYDVDPEYYDAIAEAPTDGI